MKITLSDRIGLVLFRTELSRRVHALDDLVSGHVRRGNRAAWRIHLAVLASDRCVKKAKSKIQLGRCVKVLLPSLKKSVKKLGKRAKRKLAAIAEVINAPEALTRAKVHRQIRALET